jgi:hypothetical protein
MENSSLKRGSRRIADFILLGGVVDGDEDLAAA